MKKKLCLVCLGFVFFPFLFASQPESVLQVVSPVEGTWANKQALILDVPDSFEVYYSFTGSDPLSFGFAYDGPVLIDAEGSVPLRIAVVAEDGTTEHIRIPYTVRQPDVSWRLPFDTREPVMLYSSGDTIPIPEEFLYCLGKNTVPDIHGRALTLAGGSFPARYVPCTVTDGVNYWRFVIATASHSAGESLSNPLETDMQFAEEEQPPFIVSDWDYITFNRTKLIYCIDDGFWAEAAGSVYVDRSQAHTIYWQSVAYDPANPVYSVVLPPKPELEMDYKCNTSVVLSPGGDYTIAFSGHDCEPVPSLVIDAFYGERLSEEFVVDIYLDKLYQGSFEISVEVDKEPPARPVIVPGTDLFYNRSPVTFDFLGSVDSSLFYNVSLVAEKNDGFSDMEVALGGYSSSSLSSDFKPYDGIPIKLDSSNGSAVMYSVSAYSQDSFGNVSSLVEYRVVIDPFNYYVSANASFSGVPDGSLARPFSSLEQVFSSAGSDDFKRIHIDGIFTMTRDVVVPPYCELHGIGNDSGLKLEGNAKIVVRSGSKVAFTNCVLELDGDSSVGSSSFFVINDATASFVGCEIVAAFPETGSVFAADSSTVTLDDCGVTVRSGRYASLFSGVRTNLTVNGGRYTAVSPTAVVFSMSAGLLNLANSDCRVYANLGRVAELSGVSASITGNKFHGELEGDSAAASRVSPVWYDGRSKFMENKDNSVSGFPGGLH